MIPDQAVVDALAEAMRGYFYRDWPNGAVGGMSKMWVMEAEAVLRLLSERGYEIVKEEKR